MASDEHLDWDEAYAAEVAQIQGRHPGNLDVASNLVGMAFSGGGIRSATFGLGVLETVKDIGILKKIDYISTVSGGGYIGAWLSANCKRAAERKAAPANAPRDQAGKAQYQLASRDWLDQSACWLRSIDHLRRYSNYLSPRLGVFSADTWSMFAVWFRNTLLVQCTVIFAIAVALSVPRPLHRLFLEWPGTADWRWATVVLYVFAVSGVAGNQLRRNKNGDAVNFLQARSWVAGLVVAGALLGSFAALIHWAEFDPFGDGPIDWRVAPIAAILLVASGFFLLPVAVKLMGLLWGIVRPREDPPREINYTQGWVQVAVVIPMMITGYLVAAVLWGQTVGVYRTVATLGEIDSYGGFLRNAWRFWPLPLSVAFASFWMLSFCSVRRRKALLVAVWAPLPAMGVLYLLLCAIMLLFHDWSNSTDRDEGHWLAFIWGPALVLLAFSLSVVTLVGIMGRQSTEAIREWWSRLGAWLGIYGFAWMMLAVMAVYGPYVTAWVLDTGNWRGSVIGGWLMTTLAGILAGGSDTTGRRPKPGKFGETAKDKLLNVVALIGPFVFVAGLLMGVGFCLHSVLLANSAQDWSGIGELHRRHWQLMSLSSLVVELTVLIASLACLVLLASRVDINEFGLNAFYRSRLARCYLGAARFLPGERNPQKFTEFDDKDDMPLAELAAKPGTTSAPGPLHIVNCALNLGGSTDLALHTRHSASFTLTPCAAGSNYHSRDMRGVSRPLGFRPTATYGGAHGQPTLSQAMSVSGAAASPNMGYHTSPIVAFFLTVFNVRLGWWFPNPCVSGIETPSPWFSLRYLLKELFGGADDKSRFLMISDGGHFENLAAYELIRRRCRTIIISDSECDPELQFEGLGTLIRMCEVDFGTRITIDVSAVRTRADSAWSSESYAVGKVEYGNDTPDGVLIYLKASMTGREGSAILQYKASHPRFPHESTANQFYGEDQFESYRHLGQEVARSAFSSADVRRDLSLVGEWPVGGRTSGRSGSVTTPTPPTSRGLSVQEVLNHPIRTGEKI